MSESKSDALPLGYEAKNQYGGEKWIRTYEYHSQSVVPYRLATRQFMLKRVVEGHGFEPWNPKEQIYSLPRLTTSLSLQKKDGAENRN